MFKLKPNPTFEFTAEIPTAGAEPQTLKLIGKHKGKKEMLDLQKRLTDAEELPQDVQVLMEILAGWKEVEGEFNEENVEQLLDAYPKASQVIYAAYAIALVDGREKNSGK